MKINKYHKSVKELMFNDNLMVYFSSLYKGVNNLKFVLKIEILYTATWGFSSSYIGKSYQNYLTYVEKVLKNE